MGADIENCISLRLSADRSAEKIPGHDEEGTSRNGATPAQNRRVMAMSFLFSSPSAVSISSSSALPRMERLLGPSRRTADHLAIYSAVMPGSRPLRLTISSPILGMLMEGHQSPFDNAGSFRHLVLYSPWS